MLGMHPGLQRRGGGEGANTLALFLLVVFSAVLLRTEARIREDMLKEAKERLVNWYSDKSMLQMPWYKDGATVQVSKNQGLCDAPGSNMTVPVTFGEFHVDGARPIDVFNTLTDTTQQTSWDPNIGTIRKLGEFPDDGVQAFAMSYPTHVPMIPAREFFMWYAYEADLINEEFWTVGSSQNNEKLHAKLSRSPDSIGAQNCLAAYYITRTATGTRVRFTQQLNIHPPFMISAQTVFDVSWGKTVDLFNAARTRALEVANNESSTTQMQIAVPSWLIQKPQPSIFLPGISTPSTGGRISFATRLSNLQVQQLFENNSALRGLLGHERVGGARWALLPFFCACVVFAVARVINQRATRAQSGAQLLPLGEFEFGPPHLS